MLSIVRGYFYTRTFEWAFVLHVSLVVSYDPFMRVCLVLFTTTSILWFMIKVWWLTKMGTRILHIRKKSVINMICCKNLALKLSVNSSFQTFAFRAEIELILVGALFTAVATIKITSCNVILSQVRACIISTNHRTRTGGFYNIVAIMQEHKQQYISQAHERHRRRHHHPWIFRSGILVPRS